MALVSCVDKTLLVARSYVYYVLGDRGADVLENTGSRLWHVAIQTVDSVEELVLLVCIF